MPRVPQHKPVRICFIALNVVIACFTLLSAYGGMVNPITTVVPALLAMTFPLWLVASVFIIIVDLLVYSKLTKIPVVAVFLCAGPFLAYCPLNIFPQKITPQDQATEFTLMSYNTYGFGNALNQDTTFHPYNYYTDLVKNGVSNAQLNYILAQNSNIVCLQESCEFIYNPTISFTKGQCDSIKEQYPYIHGRGVSILSKFPAKPIQLRQPAEEYAQFQAAEVNIHGHKTLIVSVHLQSIGLQKEDKDLYVDLTKGEGSPDEIGAVRHQLLGKLKSAFKYRARQAHMLRQQIDSLNYENVIVAGDFNDIADCYAMRVIAGKDFRNAFTQAAIGPIITYHMSRLYFHIDHVLYRGNMRPIKFSRGDIPNSDHYPIEVTFVCEEKSPGIPKPITP